VKPLEFRSDTFTLPTPAMRKAMAEAEVGDDQYGEDPTVNRLEERAAHIVGKEAGLYIASGMLGNLCGVLSQAGRGDEVILGDMAHIYQNEMGAFTVLGGLHGRTIPNREGMPALEDIEAAVRPVSGNMPRSALFCLENSHNNCGGSVITPQQTRTAAALAHERGLEDHLNARALADGLAAIRGIRIDAAKVVTNIVSFEIDRGGLDAGEVQKACAERGLRISRYLGNSPRLRMVTHANVGRADVDAALAIMNAVLAGKREPVTAAD